MDKAGSGQIVGGLIVAGVGIVFLLSNLGFIPDIGEMWPLFPIVVGIALIVSGLLRGRGSGASPPPAP